MPMLAFDISPTDEFAVVTYGSEGGRSRCRWQTPDQTGSWKRLRLQRASDRTAAERARHSRQASWITSVAFSVLLTSVVLGGITASNAAELVPAVNVIAARRGEIVETVRISGSLIARDEALVHVDEDGMEILEILVEAGERVAKGAVLARLNPRPLEIELAGNEARLLRANAAITQAESQIEDAAIAQAQAQSLANRSRALQARGVVSQEVLEERSNALARAGSMLSVARQSLSLAKADRLIIEAERSDIQRRMDLTEVRANVAGVVLRRNAEVGAVVAATDEPLFAIARDGAFELEGEVHEAGFSRLEPGMAAEITLVGDREPIAGRVRLLSGELNAETRLGRVRIALEARELTAGAFGRAEVEVASASGVLLPVTAVLASGDSTRIQVVQDDLLVERDVTTGLRADGLIEIRSGLQPGEQVVLKAANFLTPGDQIAPVDVPYDLPSGPRSAEPRLTLAVE